MFPNVLAWHPEAARALLEYRIRTLAGALDNARRLGYQVRGARATPLQWAAGLRVSRGPPDPPLWALPGRPGFLRGPAACTLPLGTVGTH